jgi:tRNA(Ile)-lysidine synthetase-like protein
MLETFITEWLSNPQWWFCPTFQYDSEITTKYAYILQENFFLSDLSQRELAALCIAYDQIPRHAFRGDGQQIDYFLQLSLTCFREIRDIREFSGHYLCFLLLPLRHTKIQENINYASSVIWDKLKEGGNNVDLEIYKRFLKATYKVVCDKQFLEYYEPKRIPVEQLQTFLHENAYIFDNISVPQITLHDYEYDPHKDNAIVSLSGGVDSMVLSLVTKLNKNTNCICIHINYANRETSDKETEFVRLWCSYIGVPLFVRKIDEIHRPTCMKFGLREMYESYTKEVRFKCYKQLSSINKYSFILLGHNKDDCFENILTNMNKGNFENMKGMNSFQIFKEGFNILRPFLDIPKDQLVDVAKAQGLPYLYDSTPSWSQRGKIRDKIVPAFKHWNDNFANPFFDLVNNLNQLNEIKNDYIDNILKCMFLQEDGSYKIHFNIPSSSEIVWRALFERINIHQPSKKALKLLCDKVKTREKFQVHLSKTVTVKGDQHTFIIGINA